LASGSGDHDSFLAAWRPYLDDLPGLMAMVNTQEGAGVESLLAVADQIISDYCVDPDQLHVMGTSWSAGMAVNMACEASGRVASFTAGIGGEAPSPDCQPIRPVPLLSFTGDFDRTEDTKLVEAWVELNGCEPDPTVDDLGSGVAHKTFQQCEADVEFYDIAGMGHAWPLNEAIGPGAPLVEVYSEVDYLDESIRFFAKHSLS
jgi:poly(3-hydroxybutyrate) depolymerase